MAQAFKEKAAAKKQKKNVTDVKVRALVAMLIQILQTASLPALYIRVVFMTIELPNIPVRLPNLYDLG